MGRRCHPPGRRVSGHAGVNDLVVEPARLQFLADQRRKTLIRRQAEPRGQAVAEKNDSGLCNACLCTGCTLFCTLCTLCTLCTFWLLCTRRGRLIVAAAADSKCDEYDNDETPHLGSTQR